MVPIAAGEVGSLLPVMEQAREYARRSKAPATRRGYASDWRSFVGWCSVNGLVALPASPGTVCLYLSACADRLKASTIQRHVSAISQWHQAKGFESPTRNPQVHAVLSGIRRTLGTMPNEKAPLLAADMREMVAALPRDLRGVRDRALLLLGFAGAFRRSELVALDFEDIEFTEEGLAVMLRRSKTDQDGAGRKIGVPMLPHSDACPTAAVKAWLEASGITAGALFHPIALGGRMSPNRLSDRSVALIVKRSLPTGKDATKHAGHSLRSGFCSAAANGNASMKSIMRTTGHRSLSTLMRYIREANLFKGNALASTGL
jgi:site-specific recombinase XerD